MHESAVQYHGRCTVHLCIVRSICVPHVRDVCIQITATLLHSTHCINYCITNTRFEARVDVRER